MLASTPVKKLPFVILMTFAALTACSSTPGVSAEPDVDACRAAMTRQFEEAMKAGAGAEEGTRPAACEGVDDATLEKIAGELITRQLEDALG